ncbi:esterase-like activity of phytase family protein [Streptomyces sp. P9-A4]|uniref:esterase-like activity of phytase family protein n=1 Tax=Streptomyces sp. P9-A4 TaxID=3072285 RepID=UPI002FCC9236
MAGAGFEIRVNDTTTHGAFEVRDMDSLAGQKVVPMRKKLVADFHDLGLSTVDNTEGMTWGPTLPGGERTLLLASDDNFAQEEVTQIVALVLRRTPRATPACARAQDNRGAGTGAPGSTAVPP